MSTPAHTPKLSRRWQFSLGTLLAMMGWAAVMCIALKSPTLVWAAIMFLAAFAGLMASLVGILLLAGRRRAFAIGYFAFSLGYVACLCITERPQAMGTVQGQMPISQFASWAFQQMHKDSVQTMTAPMGSGMGGYGGGGMGGMGGGFGGPGGFNNGGGGGGGGGGGFFSVDSSETASESDSDMAAGTAQSAEGDSVAAEGSAGGPMEGSGMEGMGVGGMPGGDSSMGGDMSGMPGMTAMPGLGSPGGMATAATYTVPLYDPQTFVLIVHCLLAMLLGLAGGFLGQVFYSTTREVPRESPAATTVAR